MITTMHIKNIGIIDEVTINLNEGFNVLTGETGAGKTLIIDSLNLICGARFSKEMIRKGEKYCLVEICMYLPNLEISEDSNVIVTREIHENGKNLCKINGRFVTVAELREFMKYHIDIHGQYDNQVIMDESNHINYLDDFSKEKIYEIKKEYIEKYNEYMCLTQKLKSNFGDEKEKERILDILNYELEEIDNACLKDGEEEDLKQRAELIKNSEKINLSLTSSIQLIQNNLIDNIDEVIKNISKISHMDYKYNKILDSIKEAYYSLEDSEREISSEINNLEFNEEEAENIFKRIDLISNLKRKYGSSIKEILEYRENINNKINEINNNEEINKKIKENINVIKEKMYDLAIKMNTVRCDEAKKLSLEINNNFKQLEMNNASIQIEVVLDTNNNFNYNGLNKVRFLICTNKGEEYKSLIKIASGGEISRIILAIKSVISEIDLVETYIFDEIDTGISGKAAKAVGLKMKKIADKHQIICVTHLASVAACANYHYYIYKSVEDLKTKTNIKLLNEEEVTNEIARISCGEITDISKKYASELKKMVV